MAPHRPDSNPDSPPDPLPDLPPDSPADPPTDSPANGDPTDGDPADESDATPDPTPDRIPGRPTDRRAGRTHSARADTQADAETLALIALAHVASDEELLPRFLALSGLDLDDLRACAQDPAMLGAVLDFLLAHEPDLIRFAELQEIAPAAIAKARRALPGAAIEE